MSKAELHEPRLEDEDALLAPWLAAFERAFGEAPRVAPIDADHPLERRITVPLHAFQPMELTGGTGYFRHLPAVVEHVRRLGFDWGEQHRVLTVPTPATLRARLARYGIAGAGYDVVYVRDDRPVLALGPWLRRVIQGTWTVHVCRRAFYDAGLGGADAQTLRFQIASMIHDLGTHALNYHLVPHARIRELGDRIRAAVPERWAAWESADATIPLHLSYFYDNDLNRYCYAVWCRSPTPDAFAAVFDRHFDQLLRGLDVRLDEVQRGLGDVASGDTRDMPPPTPVPFSVL